MDVSVIIVSWNARRFLEECLASIYETSAPAVPEVIVVDNASTDGSAEMVEERFPNVRLVRCEENLGFARANNIGIALSQKRYIALINSDVKLLGRCLETLATFLDRNPKVGLVGPRILNSDSTLQSSCRRFPNPWNNLCAATGLARLSSRSRLFSGEHMLYFRHDQVRPVDVLVGCFWMMRREAMDAVGLLDEGFFIFAEDVDWCRRCWNAGWEILFCPDAQAIHHRGGSSVNDPIRFAVEQHRALLRYWRKHHGVLGRLYMVVLLGLGQLLRYISAFVSTLVRRSAAAEGRLRMRKASACLRALFDRDCSRVPGSAGAAG